ncbi:hypothetical protein T4C_13911 [Trichinella pseudospiralis]|uniref:Uncharacterized protein n=1 Tax=Trichinella pseudospiralis TaxID=6337 RepID=A0A0V1K3Y1_TRIPS|nr:hypothetical protein T4C_13911 [Trichinella pseudospiralis]
MTSPRHQHHITFIMYKHISAIRNLEIGIEDLKIFTSICDGFEREIIKELDEEDLLNVKEKWCVVLLKTNDAPYRSSFPLLKSFIWILHINELNQRLAVLSASAACLWSHLEQLYNYSYYTGILFTYNRPEVSRYSTDEKYSFSTAFVHFHITLPNVQAAAAVVSSVPDDSWLTLQSTLQQPCQVSVKAGCAGSRGVHFWIFRFVVQHVLR